MLQSLLYNVAPNKATVLMIIISPANCVCVGGVYTFFMSIHPSVSSVHSGPCARGWGGVVIMIILGYFSLTLQKNMFPSTDSRKAVVSFWPKTVHNTG